MESKRFDQLVASLAGEESSRRSMLQRFGVGGLAAVLAAIGIGGIAVEEADAKRSCRRCRRRKKGKARRRCRRRCKQKGVALECTGTGQCPGTEICVNNTCVDRPAVPVACSDTDPCDGGLTCVSNICVLPCDGDEDCAGALLCLSGSCVLDEDCEDDTDCTDPLLDICLLGLCVDGIL